ncbi:hypothetical protein HO173_009239 [Letharia columbiana]|uniref:Uncharacterized protein n=1 Tax=Letharia columbiana TaxID=112416 RepID=A0A8H6FQ33_9LECA|nr:uncharacterized protein HO173_009239 [Letharia columbiana]KAF6232571.1 hypothetical protein HO173_009239 [Letharia columbiana]
MASPPTPIQSSPNTQCQLPPGVPSHTTRQQPKHHPCQSPIAPHARKCERIWALRVVMVSSVSYGDSGEEASKEVDGEEGVDGGGEESEGDEEDGALSVLQQRYGKMQKKGKYSAAGPRGFEAFLFDGDDILLHRY